MPSIQHEIGDSTNAQTVARRFFSTDFFDSLAILQKLAGSFTVKSGFIGYFDERLAGPDIPAFREVCVKQCFHEIILLPLLLTEPNQAMGIECVRRSLDPTEGKG